MKRHRRKEARYDGALRRGERRGDTGDGDRGGPVPGRRRAHAGCGRLRGRAARVGAGRRAEDLEGRARPPDEERRARRIPAPRRVPRPFRGSRPRRERDRGDLRGGRQGQGRRHLDRQGLPGHDQAAQVPPRPRHARFAQHPQAGLDWRLGDAVTRLQGHQDGRPDGRQARHAGRPHGPRRRRREEPAAREGRRSGPKNAIVEIREES